MSSINDKKHKNMEIHIKDLAHIKEAATEFVDAMGNRRLFAFYGKMGVGKTTFIKAVCAQLGVEDAVTSPTFAIINEYETADGGAVYHFDFYRVKRIAEAYDIGCDEYFYSGGLCLMEWPELVEEILPKDTVKVYVTELPDGSRTVTF